MWKHVHICLNCKNNKLLVKNTVIIFLFAISPVNLSVFSKCLKIHKADDDKFRRLLDPGLSCTAKSGNDNSSSGRKKT